jgi:hypothetical protein
MQIKRDFAGSTDMWPTSAGGQLIEVANLTGFTVPGCFGSMKTYIRIKRQLLLKQSGRRNFTFSCTPYRRAVQKVSIHSEYLKNQP